jgi:putative intracellular protease/amidase
MKEEKFMFTIYVYVLDTLADWELGYVTAELNSGRFFKKSAQRVSLKTVSYSKDPIHTMGGMTIVPDCLIDDMAVSETSVLILPGANTWNDPRHGAIIEKASEFLSAGATVCAICGATAALASFGLLDKRPHTSNGPGFLEMVSSGYKGQSFYIDEPSVADNNLITASSTGALLWAKQIIEHLGVFQSDTLEVWYEYFSTGEAKHFFALMQTLPSGNEN